MSYEELEARIANIFSKQWDEAPTKDEFLRATHAVIKEIRDALQPPSAEMLDKGEHINSEWLNDNAPIGQSRYRHPAEAVYRAMLDASPLIPRDQS